jgi:hypothetical protein
MRPANFPTIRLAQLAMLVHESSHLFSKIKSFDNIQKVKRLFDVTCNDHWHYHYSFDEPTPYKPKRVGNQMTNHILINAIIPTLFAYGMYSKEEQYKDKAIAWLRSLSAEQNSITKSWKALNIENRNSLDSQALIQLTNNYCKQNACLNCAVGNKLLMM